MNEEEQEKAIFLNTKYTLDEPMRFDDCIHQNGMVTSFVVAHSIGFVSYEYIDGDYDGSFVVHCETEESISLLDAFLEEYEGKFELEHL